MRLITLIIHKDLKSPDVAAQRSKSNLFDSHMNYEKILQYNFALNCKYFSWDTTGFSEKIGKLTIHKIEEDNNFNLLLDLNDHSPVSSQTKLNKKFGRLIEKMNYLLKMHVKC